MKKNSITIVLTVAMFAAIGGLLYLGSGNKNTNSGLTAASVATSAGVQEDKPAP